MHRAERERRSATLTFPVLAAIVSMDDESTFADRPTVFVGSEINIPNAVPDVSFNFAPCLSTIVTHCHSTTSTNSDGAISIGELDIL